MAVNLVRTCPHCGTEKIALSYLAHRAHPDGRSATVVFTCNRCSAAYAVLVTTAGYDLGWLANQHGDFDETIKASGRFVNRSEYPRAKVIEAPAHISAPVKRCFMQAADSAKRGHRDAAGAMYRKAIDSATRELDAALAGKNLAARIDSLHAAGKLTSDLKNWAHEVRLDGNEAAHDDEELTEAEVAQLASFSEMFLTYCFTLPKQVELRKADRAEGA